MWGICQSELLDPSVKCSSPLLDKVVKPQHRLGILQILCQTPFLPPDRPRQLLRKRLVLPELVEQRLVQQVLDVLGVVERGRGGRALIGLLLVKRVAGVDTCISACFHVRRLLGRKSAHPSECTAA